MRRKEEDVGAEALLEAVVDGPDLEVHPLEAAERAFDPAEALVGQHRVELLGGHIPAAHLLAQRVGPGLGAEAAGGDHRQRQRPHAGATPVEQPLEAQLPRRAQRGGDMAVGAGAQDLKGVVEGSERGAALEQHAQSVDDVVGQLRHVGQGALPDLAAFAEGLAEQHGGPWFPVGLALSAYSLMRRRTSLARTHPALLIVAEERFRRLNAPEQGRTCSRDGPRTESPSPRVGRRVAACWS